MDYLSIIVVITTIVALLMANVGLIIHLSRKPLPHNKSGDQGRDCGEQQVLCAPIEPSLIGIPRVDLELIEKYFQSRGLSLSSSEISQFYQQLSVKQGISIPSESQMANVTLQSRGEVNVNRQTCHTESGSSAEQVHILQNSTPVIEVPSSALSLGSEVPRRSLLHSTRSIVSNYSQFPTPSSISSLSSLPSPIMSSLRAPSTIPESVVSWDPLQGLPPSSVLKLPGTSNTAPVHATSAAMSAGEPRLPVALPPTGNAFSSTALIADSTGPTLTLIILSAQQIRQLQKSAKETVPKLTLDSTFGFFSAWRSAVVDWLAVIGVCGDGLAAESVRLLTRQMFSAEFHEELRRQGVLDNPTWGAMLSKTRQLLGFDRATLRAKLRECRQSATESSKTFLYRFCWLKSEGGTSDEDAKDMLLNALVPHTKDYLERRLETFLGSGIVEDDQISETERLERVPFAVIVKLLKRGPLLEAYPAKASKVDLRTKGGERSSVNATTLVATAAPFVPLSPVFSTQLSSSPAAASTNQAAASSQLPSDPSQLPSDPSWNQLLSVAALSTPTKFAEDPLVAIAGLAQVLDDSYQAAKSSGNSLGAKQIANTALEVASCLQALSTVHPTFQNAANELMPRRGVRRDYPTQSLFDIARSFSRRVPMARLVEIEPDIRPYLASLIVRAVYRAGDNLVVPRNLRLTQLADDEFEQYQLGLAAKSYNMYGALSQMVQEGQTTEAIAELRGQEVLRLNDKVSDLTCVIKTMQEQLQAYFARGRGDDFDMDSTAGHVALVEFKPAQKTLIDAIDKQVAQVDKRGACTIQGVSKPGKGVKQYKDMSHYVPTQKLTSSQVHVRAAVLGGAAPGRGIIMMDSGAALSVLSEKVCEVHGLKVRGPAGHYTTADGSAAKLIGVTDVSLQFNDYFQVDLQQVAVQPGSEYQILVGGDVMWGSAGQLGDVVITPGKCVSFQVLTMEGAKFEIPCTAQKFPTATAATTQLPPPPASSGLPSLADIATDLLTPAQKHQLAQFAAARKEQLTRDAPKEEAHELINQVWTWMNQHSLPKALSRALGRCLWRRTSAISTDQLLALTLTNLPRGEESMWNALAEHGVYPSSSQNPKFRPYQARYPNSKLPQRQ